MHILNTLMDGMPDIYDTCTPHHTSNHSQKTTQVSSPRQLAPALPLHIYADMRSTLNHGVNPHILIDGGGGDLFGAGAGAGAGGGTIVLPAPLSNRVQRTQLNNARAD